MTEDEDGGVSPAEPEPQIQVPSAELAVKGARLGETSELLQANESTRASAERAAELQRQLNFAEEHIRDLTAQLAETRDSLAWQVLNRVLGNWFVAGVWNAAKAMAPTWLRQEVKARLRQRRGPNVPQHYLDQNEALSGTRDRAKAPEDLAAMQSLIWHSESEMFSGCRDFLSRIDDSRAEDLVLFVAGVKFIETEGQRVTQLIRDLVRHNIPALLLYHRWRSEYHQALPKSTNALFFQIPMDLFMHGRMPILDHPFRSSLRRTCIFEFPHPWTLQWVEEFKSTGWVTIYDIIDDWEEFHRAGKALWFKAAAERQLSMSCDATTAISSTLAEKARTWVPGREVRVVPNGVALDLFDLARPAQLVRCGEVTVGYFGFLTPAWFDWGLVATVARRRPKWEFHIIGFGERPPANLPRNVQLLGRVPHYLLGTYARNWDVTMVPFRPNALSRHADPIKVYEYLALGLPVVATNIPHLRKYPGVYVAESVADFERLLEQSSAEDMDREAVDAFLRQSTWLKRGQALLEAGRDRLGTGSA